MKKTLYFLVYNHLGLQGVQMLPHRKQPLCHQLDVASIAKFYLSYKILELPDVIPDIADILTGSGQLVFVILGLALIGEPVLVEFQELLVL